LWPEDQHRVITYQTFIGELRRLAGQIDTLRNEKQMDEAPAFRLWRHELQSLFSQIKQAGYELPGKMDSEVRRFGGLTEYGERAGFRAYQRDMDDTANELRTIINAYERDGEPPRRTAGGGLRAPLAAPEKVTWPWIRDNVPLPFALKVGAAALGVIAVAISAAYQAGKYSLIARLLGEPISTATESPKESPKPPATAAQSEGQLTWNDAINIERAFMVVPRPCKVKLSATNENRNARNILAHIIRENGACEIVDAMVDSQASKVDVDAPPAKAPEGLVVRWNQKYAPGEQVFAALNGFLKAQSGHAMPANSPADLIWIEVGTGYPWKR
jgi:hypothetical protein